MTRSKAVAVATGLVVVGMTLTSSYAATARPVHAWHAAKAPKRFKGGISQLAAVPHSSDLWAVAFKQTTYNATATPLVLRRHAGKWKKEPKPSVGAYGHVRAVAVGSKSDIWVGGDSQSGTHPVVAKWNGKKFVTQKVPGDEGGIEAMAASSSKNVWAVGNVSVNFTVMADHWDGSSWKAVSVPNNAPLPHIATTSAKNAWAVDNSNNVLHWDGEAWAVSLPASANVAFSDVTASGKAALVAGTYTDSSTGVSKAVIERFDGKKWSKMKTPHPYHAVTLNAVGMTGSHAWAIGGGVNPNQLSHNVLLQLKSGKWKRQQLSSSIPVSAFSDVVAVSKKLAYLVGTTYDNYGAPPRADFVVYNGHKWRGVSSAY